MIAAPFPAAQPAVLLLQRGKALEGRMRFGKTSGQASE
jgi:hypothetical protein